MNSNNLNDPITTIIRRDVFRKNGFIYKIYQDWYKLVKENLQFQNARVVELGSGAGFIKDHIPGVITSDVMFLPFIDSVLNGANLPFPNHSFDGLVMIDVFHHIPDVDRFINESIRIIRGGGRIIMIEPWMNPWSQWVYSNLHHEAIDLVTEDWRFSSSGPLSGANQALPWIVFDRDRKLFEEKYPALKINKIVPMMPFLYLLSGGFRNNISMPAFSFPFWKRVEKIFFNTKKWGMFGLIVLEKIR
ncbi:MAG: methyltransferase domain-containing protein [Pelolinea sp.]|nr:methyltransferase domain-containing protein [Pelolinea sp.]